MASPKNQSYFLYFPPNTHMHQFVDKGGKELVRVVMPKLPPFTMDGQQVDLSGGTALFNAKCVRKNQGSDSSIRISVPMRNSQGEPWVIEIRLSEGRWENEYAITSDERGEFIITKDERYTIAAPVLAEALSKLCQTYSNNLTTAQTDTEETDDYEVYQYNSADDTFIDY